MSCWIHPPLQEILPFQENVHWWKQSALGQHTEKVMQSSLTCQHTRAGHSGVTATADPLPLGLERSIYVSVAVLPAALGGEDTLLLAHLLFRSDERMCVSKLKSITGFWVIFFIHYVFSSQNSSCTRHEELLPEVHVLTLKSYRSVNY